MFAIRTAVIENPMTHGELAAAGITPETVAEMLRGNAVAAWIGYDRDGSQGFSMARAAIGDVFALFVLPAAEGHGLGSRLLGEAEQWLASQGVAEAWLLTGGEPGLRAPGFYAARGWRSETREPDGQLRFTKRLLPPR